MNEPPIKPRKSKSGSIALIGASSVVGILMAGSVISGLNESEAPASDELIEIATSLNAELPAMIDQHTRLESTLALPGGKFMYNLTVVGLNRPPRRDQIVRQARPKITERYRTSDELKEMRDAEVTLVYLYADESGNELARFEVTPEDS